jgi:hypothetical protein
MFWCWVQGLEPTATFTRKLLLLKPTLYTAYGCK